MNDVRPGPTGLWGLVHWRRLSAVAASLMLHPSGFSNPPDCTPATPQCSLSGAWNTDPSFFAFTRIGQYRDLMVSNGESNKKIWFTEFGYCAGSTPPPGSEYFTYLSAKNQAE